MASSSTNKQPLLIDRPLHETAVIGDMAALSNPLNLTTVLPAGLKLLVDCGSNDGAFIDSISVFFPAGGAYLQGVPGGYDYPLHIVCFISNGADYIYVCGQRLPSPGGYIGERLHVSLPLANTPVPRLSVSAADYDSGYPGEATKKNTSLMIPAGSQLYVGTSVPITGPSTSSRLVVSAQGGYY